MLLLHFAIALLLQVKSWVDDLDEVLDAKLEEWLSLMRRGGKLKSIRLKGPEVLDERIVPANTDL